MNTLAPSTLNSMEAIEAHLSSELLQDLYVRPNAITSERMRAAIDDSAHQSTIQKLRGLLCTHDITCVCEELIRKFEQDTGQPTSREELFLILGCHTTTIYTVPVACEPGEGMEDASVLCLESLDGQLSKLKMLLAHEFTHIVHKRLLHKDIFESCIGERIVTEGIAQNYSRETVPGASDAACCLVDPATVAWTKANKNELAKRMRNHLADASLMSDLFYMYAHVDFPVRTGYVYGYYAVRDYLQKNGLAVKDVLSADWRTLLFEEN